MSAYIHSFCDAGGLPWQMLRRLIKAVESFLHPSNGGYWTHRLADLVCALCEYFYRRVLAERRNLECAGLQQSDIMEFASIMLPVALQGLYSKSVSASMQSCAALKYLGLLDANNSLPSCVPPSRHYCLDHIYGLKIAVLQECCSLKFQYSKSASA